MPPPPPPPVYSVVAALTFFNLPLFATICICLLLPFFFFNFFPCSFFFSSVFYLLFCRNKNYPNSSSNSCYKPFTIVLSPNLCSSFPSLSPNIQLSTHSAKPPTISVTLFLNRFKKFSIIKFSAHVNYLLVLFLEVCLRTN